MSEETPADPKRADAVIQAFGGIRPMAGKLDIPVTTVQGWKKRGAIPASRREEILAAAKRLDITLDPAMLDQALVSADAAAEEAADAAVSPENEPEMSDEAAQERTVRAWAPEPAIQATSETAADPAPQPAPEPARESTPAATPAAAKKGGGFGAFIGTLAFLLVAVVIARDYWAPLLPAGIHDGLPSVLTGRADERGPDVTAQLEALRQEVEQARQSELREVRSGLERELADLEDRLDRLARETPDAVADPQAVSRLQDEQNALAERLETLANQVADRRGRATSRQAPAIDAERLNTVSQEVAALDDRVETLEARPRLQSTVESLQGTVAAIDNRVSDIATRLGDTRESVSAIQGLSQRVAQLGDKVNEFQVSLASRENLSQAIQAAQGDLQSLRQQLSTDKSALQEEIGGLESRLDSLRDRVARTQETRLREEALVLAVAQLRAAARTGGDIAGAFDLVDSLLNKAGETPEGVRQAARTLSRLSGKGVPTQETLRQRFDGLADEITRAAITGEDPGWWDETLLRLTSVVNIRPVGERKGEDTAAIVARAERRLAEGNLAAAIDELKALSGRPASTAAPWVADAERRLALDTALTTITDFAVGRLGGAAGSGGGAQ